MHVCIFCDFVVLLCNVVVAVFGSFFHVFAFVCLLYVCTAAVVAVAATTPHWSVGWLVYSSF